MSKDYTEFLEAYGFKAKIAERLDIRESRIGAILHLVANNEGRRAFGWCIY